MSQFNAFSDSPLYIFILGIVWGGCLGYTYFTWKSLRDYKKDFLLRKEATESFIKCVNNLTTWSKGQRDLSKIQLDSLNTLNERIEVLSEIISDPSITKDLREYLSGNKPD